MVSNSTECVLVVSFVVSMLLHVALFEELYLYLMLVFMCLSNL